MGRGSRLSFLFIAWLQATGVKAQDALELCGTFLGRGEYELALHRSHEERFRALGLAPAPRSSIAQVGNIAVIEGNSRLVLPANPFDLARRAVAFEPQSPQGYSATALEADVESGLGQEIPLTTYGSHPVDLQFPFPFYGAVRNKLFVNANGSLTFNFADGSFRTGSTQFLSSLPRIAAYYSPLDPAAGGKVLVASHPDRLVVTWVDIPEREDDTKSTFQVVLEPSGRILVRFGRVGAPSGLVGVSFPLGVSGSDIVDLSAGGQGRGAVFEEFRQERLVDRTATVRRFYEANPDLYDFIVLWTTFDSDMGGSLAFETTVRNNVRGIGVSLFNASGSWGSRGQLQSVIMMGNLANYPDEPHALLSRSDRSTVAIVAHEVGHRWLSFVDVMTGDAKSNALLGRGQVHWSFFKDTDASFMYGEELAQESSDRFRTTETWSRFSNLDLYLMGFAPAAEVAPFLLVEQASGRDGRGRPLTAESYPERGVSFRGTPRNVLLDDIIRAEGSREPAFGLSQTSFRQAWLLLHSEGSPPSAEQLGKLEAIRSAFEPYIQDKTLGRAIMSTRLGQ